METDEAYRSSPSLIDLPGDCLLRALSMLESPQDLLVFEATCRHFWLLGRLAESWIPRLKRDFGLSLKASPSRGDCLQQLYADIQCAARDTAIRFRGCFTDGGCDNSMAQYWVDNLFCATHWHSFCSAKGCNVNCIGVLTEQEQNTQQRAAERSHRDFIIRRCMLPHGVIYGTITAQGNPPSLSLDTIRREHTRLDRLTTTELEHLLAELFAEYQQRTALGKLLFLGLNASAFRTEVYHVHAIVREMWERDKKTVREVGITASKDNNVLVDPAALRSLMHDGAAGRYVGVVDEVSINRMGNFSCPVSTGVVFIANMDVLPGSAISQTQIEQAMKELVERNTCCAFHDVKSGATLFRRSKSGELPRIIRSGRSYAGKWCEFDTSCMPSDEASPSPSGRVIGSLRPLFWFQFWTRLQALGYARAMEDLGRDPVTGAPRGGPAAYDKEDDPEPDTEATVIVEETVSSGELLQEMGGAFDRWEYLANHFAPDDLEMTVGSYDENFLGEAPQVDHDQGSAAGGLGEREQRPCINQLDVRLTRPKAGNLVLVKLIDQEDLMDEWNDMHDAPNIDATFVAFKGRSVVLPEGIKLCCD